MTGPVPRAGTIPVLSELDVDVRTAYRDAFGAAFGEAFLVIAPLALLAVVCVARIRTTGSGPRGADQAVATGPVADV